MLIKYRTVSYSGVKPDERVVKEFIFDGTLESLRRIQFLKSSPDSDSLIDLTTQDFGGRLFPMDQFQPIYKSESHYAMFARPELVARLKTMLSVLPESLGVAVYEAFRPVSLQQSYFISKAVELGHQHPDWDNHRLYDETSKWVAPFLDGSIPPHCTGAAIDLVLVDLGNNELLDMGKFGVLWGENKVAATLADGLTPMQKQNRLHLIKAAFNAGLKNYAKEYWHLSYGDQMWGALTNNLALFGPVMKPEFDPNLHTICKSKEELMQMIRVKISEQVL